MYSSRSYVLFVFSVFFIGTACSPIDSTNYSDNESFEQKAPESPGNFVNIKLAKYAAEQFANSFDFNYDNLARRKIKQSNKEKVVKNVLRLKSGKNKTALYLINYKKGGFVIVPADKRESPILAYSEINSLPTSKDQQVPAGFAFWTNQKVKKISALRSAKSKNQSIPMHFGWEGVLSTKKGAPSPDPSIIYPPDDPPCESWRKQVGPLVQTNWGQADGYNNLAPDYGCDYPFNGRAFSGCVATAIAQIMRYHEYPQWYEWSVMPDVVINKTGYNADVVSGLMRNIGDRVDMSWGCEGADIPLIPNASGADDDDMDNVFQSYGYVNAHQIGYDGTGNYEDVKDELDAGRPVLFSGCEEGSFGPISYPNGCHAWVGDGYRSGSLCPSGGTYLLFSMNWGWAGKYNGFYGLGNFEPGDHDYDYKSEVVIGIQP
jgi:streptopain